MTFVFVYGTLKQGGSNHSWLADQIFRGEAQTIAGFRLFGLDGYPGMISLPSDTEGVRGEIWEVTDACLARLDELEGLQEGLYRREPIRLLPPNDTLVVQTYIYARSTAGRMDLGGFWPV